MSGQARARELVAEIAEVLQLAGLDDDVHVTVDVLSVGNALAAGQPAVAVLPPRMESVTQASSEYEWALLVTAGPVQDQLAAWESIDAIITALWEPLALQTAEPDAFQPANGAPYPAYQLTFKEII